jgi:hypothetical protein
MDAKAKRRIVREMLDKLKRDMFLAIDRMLDDWDEVGWYLVRRAELFCIHRASDRLRRKAYENALRTRRLGAGSPLRAPMSGHRAH